MPAIAVLVVGTAVTAGLMLFVAGTVRRDARQQAARNLAFQSWLASSRCDPNPLRLPAVAVRGHTAGPEPAASAAAGEIPAVSPGSADGELR